MAWSDVASKLKFYGPLLDDLGNETGLDGAPPTVNGGVTPYGGAFTLSEKNEILSALQDLYATTFHPVGPEVTRLCSGPDLVRIQ